MRVLLIVLLMTLAACSKDRDEQFASCDRWQTASYTYGNGQSYKSHQFACTDYDGKDCGMIYAIEEPTLMETDCRGTPSTGRLDVFPYKTEEQQ